MENRRIVHIALVGGQTMPVYLALGESRADRIVLLYSSSTKSEAEKLEIDLKAERSCQIESAEFPPFDFVKLRELADSLLKKYSEWDIEINLSSGTKPWSIVFAMLAGKYDNVQLLYVDQNSIIYNYTTSQHHLAAPMDGGIAQMLRYNQTAIESHTNLNEYTDSDRQILPEVKNLRNSSYHGKGSIFNTLTIPGKNNKARFSNNIKDTVIDKESGSKITWDKKYQSANGIEQFVELNLAERSGFHKHTFVSPHAFDIITSSGWFEYEVATILKKWASSKEIWLNVIFPYDNKNPKNEIDIIVATEYKMLFVECKTQIFERTDIDKFASAVKNYGGMGSKAIFITQQNMDTQAVEKCDTNKIAHFSLYNAEHQQVGHNILFALLDKLMQISNTR